MTQQEKHLAYLEWELEQTQAYLDGLKTTLERTQDAQERTRVQEWIRMYENTVKRLLDACNNAL